MAQYNPKKIRNAYIISTTTVALVLFLIGSVAFLIMNIYNATLTVLDDTSLSVMLSDTLTVVERNELQDKIKSFSEVKSVEYVSKDRAAEEFCRFTGENISQFIGENPLPASFNIEIVPTKDFIPVQTLDSLAVVFGKMNGVTEVLYAKEILAQIVKNITTIYVILASFFIILLVISVMLVANTIKMLVFSKRFLINTMKLVGATNGFIRKPFMINAVKQALAATFLSWLMLGAVIYGYISYNNIVPNSEDVKLIVYLCSGVLVFSFIICSLTTYLSVTKYLKLNSNDLHQY